MSAVLPLPEPPAADVQDALDRLRVARLNARDAVLQAERLTAQLDAVPRGAVTSSASVAWFVIEQEVADVRRTLWARHVAVCEARCRRLGLDPDAGAGPV